MGECVFSRAGVAYIGLITDHGLIKDRERFNGGTSWYLYLEQLCGSFDARLVPELIWN
jgi:hypothetical protein